MANKGTKTTNRNSRTTKVSTLRKPTLSKWPRLLLVLVIMSVGVYFLFFAHAATLTECRAVPGGNVCDFNQMTDGTDSVLGDYSETKNINWPVDDGIVLTAPKFAMNGAKPVYRFNRPDWTAHSVAIEGSADYNTAINDLAPNSGTNCGGTPKQGGHYICEGLSFYAWPGPGQPDTVPIRKIGRGGWYIMNLYVDNQDAVNYYVGLADHSYADQGVVFYAYPGRYVPKPTATATTKDSDCANKALQQYDKGDCVKQLKTNLKKFGSSVNVDPNNNELDKATVDYVTYFVVLLKQSGVQVDTFGTVVTPSIWNALAGGPIKPSSPAAAPVTTGAPTSSTATAVDCSTLANFASSACDAQRAALNKKLQTTTGSGTTAKPKNSNSVKDKNKVTVSDGAGGTTQVDKPDSSKKYSADCPSYRTALDTDGKGDHDKLPLSPSCIRAMQQMFNKYVPNKVAGPKLNTDGVWGPQTKEALNKFKQYRALTELSKTHIAAIASGESGRAGRIELWTRGNSLAGPVNGYDWHIQCDVIYLFGDYTNESGDQEPGSLSPVWVYNADDISIGGSDVEGYSYLYGNLYDNVNYVPCITENGKTHAWHYGLWTSKDGQTNSHEYSVKFFEGKIDEWHKNHNLQYFNGKQVPAIHFNGKN